MKTRGPTISRLENEGEGYRQKFFEHSLDIEEPEKRI